MPLTLKLFKSVRLLASIKDPVISLVDKSRILRFDNLANESIGPDKSLPFNLISKKESAFEQSSFSMKKETGLKGINSNSLEIGNVFQ